MEKPFAVRPDEGRTIDLGTFQAVVLADAESTTDGFTLIQTRGEPHGFGPPLHVHRDAAEAFYVLEGTYRMYFEGREEDCPPGTFVYVPRDTPHTFKVTSERPGKKLNLFAPAAMVGFFEELADAEAVGEVTPERLDEIALHHHMEVVGPVPDTYL